MSTSTGVHSYGTVLNLDHLGGVSYTAIAEVKKITGPGVKVGSAERTNLTSPSAVKEFVAGLIDAGELTFTLNWTKAQYSAVLGYLRVNLMTFQIVFPLVGIEVTPSKLVFHGHITELGFDIPEDDIITNDMTVKVTDIPVFTAGT